MGKITLSSLLRKISFSAKKHSPEILTGIGIAGMISTTIMAVKATPKALVLIERKKEELGVDELPLVEAVKTSGLCYAPSVITGVLSVGCLIGANSVHVKHKAALATAYTISESALKEYKTKVIETIGEKKEQSIKDAVSKERLEKVTVYDGDILRTGKGQTLCFDAFTGQLFESDIDKIKSAINDLNAQLINDWYVSLNDFYELLGLPYSEMGDLLGWNMDLGLVEINFSSQLTEDQRPCLVLDYYVAPKYDFTKA